MYLLFFNTDMYIPLSWFELVVMAVQKQHIADKVPAVVVDMVTV